MATARNYWTTTLLAADDLSNIKGGLGSMFKALAADGNIAANGLDAIGLVQYPGQDGEHVTIGWMGEMKFTAGSGGVVAGQILTVATSGYCVAITSAKYTVGRNMELSVASGAVGRGIFNFSQPTLINCVP